MRTSKYKNSFAKGYVLNWFEEVFVIEKVKNTLQWTYLIEDLNGEDILLELFMKKSYKKTIPKSYRTEKIIKRRSNELYVKWKSDDNWFNSWIDKKDTSI